MGIVYGNPEVTSGGRALKYYSSVRIDVRRIEALKDSSASIIGNPTRARVGQNKVAPPFQEAEFDIMFGEGISKSGELLTLAVKLNIIRKGGAWFSYGDIRLGQGATIQSFAETPRLCPHSDIEGTGARPTPASCLPAARANAAVPD